MPGLRLAVLLGGLLTMLFVSYAHGQTLPQSLQVFLEHGDDGEPDQLIFLDPLTGATAMSEVFGERYALLDDRVLYWDWVDQRVMLAGADGTVSAHPFIQPGANTRRIDWIVSNDAKLMAWTLAEGESGNALTTITTVANIDGTNPRQALIDGPRDGIRAFPITFNADNTHLYMDYQPDGIGEFVPVQQYAGVFTVDLETAIAAYLPGEPGCFCGAGLGAGLFVRLTLAEDLRGFDARVHDLEGGLDQTITAVELPEFTQAGAVLISPDGARAVYALARVEGFGSGPQSVESVLVSVDLNSMSQAILTDPITAFLQPIAWTEDNSAVIFTSPDRNGTWKADMGDGSVTRTAIATYLGALQAGVAAD